MNDISIHPSVSIGENVIIGSNVNVGAYTIISDNVVIEENVTIGEYSLIYNNVNISKATRIGPYTIIGERTADYYGDITNYVNGVTHLGKECLIRSHSIIYADVVMGDFCQTGHRVTIREGALIGHHTRIGTLSDIQGQCRIGNYVNLHSNVHVGQASRIDDYVWIFPYVILTNDPTPPSDNLMGVVIESFAVVATGSIILPGVKVGKDSLVGAKSLVRKEVKPETVVVGNPAKEICSIFDIKNKITGEAVYPWREHFTRGMPWEGKGYDKWNMQNELILIKEN